VTGDGRITALPDVVGVVDVGAGFEPHAAPPITNNVARTIATARIVEDLAASRPGGKLPRSHLFG
jgi:hypothetical protein